MFEPKFDNVNPVEGMVTIPDHIKIPESEEEGVQLCQVAFKQIEKFNAEIEDLGSDDRVWDYLKPENSTPTLAEIRSKYAAQTILPNEYQDLEQWFHTLYENQYSTGSGSEINHPWLDYVFQQYQLAQERFTNRFGVNHFGLYIPAYLDGLSTTNLGRRYLGSLNPDHQNNPYHTLLLGCSSLSSATDFQKLIQTMNSKASITIIDRNPFVGKLLNSSGIHFLQADATDLESLNLPPMDLIATNFLMNDPSLADIIGWQEILAQCQQLLYPESGRLIMVEQHPGDRSLKQIAETAFDLDLTLAGASSPTESGIKIHALRWSTMDEFPYEMNQIKIFLDSDPAYSGKPFSQRAECQTVLQASNIVLKKPRNDITSF